MIYVVAIVDARGLILALKLNRATKVPPSCSGTHSVLVFDEDGQFVATIEGSYQSEQHLVQPVGVVMMSDGKIVVAGDSSNNLAVYFSDCFNMSFMICNVHNYEILKYDAHVQLYSRGLTVSQSWMSPRSTRY